MGDIGAGCSLVGADGQKGNFFTVSLAPESLSQLRLSAIKLENP